MTLRGTPTPCWAAVTLSCPLHLLSQQSQEKNQCQPLLRRSSTWLASMISAGIMSQNRYALHRTTHLLGVDG
jgi:hypothetical protein